MFAAGQAQRGEKSSAAQFAAIGSQSLAQRSCAANLHATPTRDTCQIYFSKLYDCSTENPQAILQSTELQLTAGQQEQLFKSRGANNPACKSPSVLAALFFPNFSIPGFAEIHTELLGDLQTTASDNPLNSR
jgi:hypothetical protein